MAEYIDCKKCHRACKTRKCKRHDKINKDILICGEIIYHKDGTKEFREYGRVNERTNQILTMSV